jgi:hypothetical protein
LSQRLVDFQPEMGWTGRSWLFTGLIGDAATRLLASVVYVLATLAFVVSGIGLLTQGSWWRPIAIGSAIFSAAAILLFWDGVAELLVPRGLMSRLPDTRSSPTWRDGLTPHQQPGAWVLFTTHGDGPLHMSTIGERRANVADETQTFHLTLIGQVKRENGPIYLAIDERYRPARKQLGHFGYVHVLWWFSRYQDGERRQVLESKPPYGEDVPVTGVFASRYPTRRGARSSAVGRRGWGAETMRQ